MTAPLTSTSGKSRGFWAWFKSLIGWLGDQENNKQAGPPLLLNYTSATSPNPIEASSDTRTNSAKMGLSVAADGATIYCKEIDVYIPSKALSATDSFSPDVNTNKWQTAVGAVVDGSEVNLQAGTGYVPIKFTCVSSADYKIDYPLVLTSSYVISVVTQVLFVRNFVASAYDSASPTTFKPGGVYDNGQPIQLSWEGNAANYEVLTVPGGTPVYSGTDNSVVLQKGLTQTTSFVLIGSLTDPVFAETNYRYANATAYIRNPDVTPKSVAVAEDVTIGSTLEVNGVTTLNNDLNVKTNSTLTGTLGVNGATTLSTATVNSTLDVKGNSTLAGVTAVNAALSGTLGVTGPATLADANIAALALTGTFAGLGAAQGVAAGGYPAAKTDGFVVGYVAFPSSIWETSMTWIWGTTGGMTVQVLGGNVSWVSQNMKSGYTASNPNSFIMPVKKGNTWSIGATNAPKIQAGAPTAFYWIPVGVGSATAPEPLSEEEAARLGFEPPEFSGEEFELYQPEREIAKLSEVLVDIFGGTVSEEDLKRVGEAIWNLVLPCTVED